MQDFNCYCNLDVNHENKCEFFLQYIGASFGEIFSWRKFPAIQYCTGINSIDHCDMFKKVGPGIGSSTMEWQAKVRVSMLKCKLR